MPKSDLDYLKQALSLAEEVLFLTNPNPRVGCVLVREGKILGQGATQAAGSAHAEVMAIRDAQAQGQSLQGATAYVTLEPCSHHGKTPPCADALVKAGVKRVVLAMVDPNPLVAGRGIARLKSAGIDVQVFKDDDLFYRCLDLNVGFFWRMLTGRPWVRTKLASSLDGRTALADGQSQWITSARARADGHHWRARSCAVVTGSGTVLADNPTLTVREVATPRQPLRVVLDKNFRLSISSELVKTCTDNQKVQVYISELSYEQQVDKVKYFKDLGVEVYTLPLVGEQLSIEAFMRAMGDHQINEIHLEAGARLNGAFLSHEYIDELLLYIAPTVLGNSARGMFAGLTLTELPSIPEFEFADTQTIGQDLRLRLRHRTHWQSMWVGTLNQFKA